MLSHTNLFVVLLPPFLKMFQSKIFFVLLNFYSLCGFQNTTVTLPFKFRHVVLNLPPHLLRVSSNYLLKTLFLLFFFYLKRNLSDSPLLSVLHLRCPLPLPVPLKISFFFTNGSEEIQGVHHRSFSNQASVQAASFSVNTHRDGSRALPIWR